MNNIYGFPWNNNVLLEEAYKQNNYLIHNTGHKTGRAIIFFSGNGLYRENTVESFAELLAKGDAGFEWINISKHERIQNYYEKIIFVRDIYKQWYVTGINQQYNSIEKVAKFLREQVEGIQVFTCGNSAGGYAAVLFGSLLGADGIFVDSAQFFFKTDCGWGPFVSEVNRDLWDGYEKLIPLIKDPNRIYYLYPAESDIDVEQLNYIKELKGVNILRIHSKIHGYTLIYRSIPYFLTMSQKERDDLFNKNRDKILSRCAATLKIVPFRDAITIIETYLYGTIKMNARQYMRSIKHKGKRVYEKSKSLIRGSC